MTTVHPRITIEPGKRGGKPCIRGMRIAVQDVPDWLADGMSELDILNDFPEIEQEDLRAVYQYVSELNRH